MKLILTGDFHLRSNTPENRVDNFFQTQLNKVEQIFEIAKHYDCKFILQPGDVTDGPRPSFELLEAYIELFNKYNIGKDTKLLHVYGQHDCRFRTKERTATKLLNFLGYLEAVNDKALSTNIQLYGCNFGEEIPIIKDKDKFNILLIHGTILDKPVWPGQEDYLHSDKLFKNGYDIIVSGDWHHPVFYQYKNQTILNCGCLVRKTINEADLEPHIYVLDINENTFEYTLEKIVINHEPADKIFKKEALARDIKKDNEKLQEFITSIKNNSMDKNLNFKKNLDILMQPVAQSVKDIILKELELINE